MVEEQGSSAAWHEVLEMLKRIKSAILALPVVIAMLWLGGAYLVALIGIVAVMASIEYAKLVRTRGLGNDVLISSLFSFLYVADAFIFGGANAMPLTMVLLIACLTLPVLEGSPEGAIAGTAGTLFPSIYFGWTLSHAVLLRESLPGKEGFYLTILVLALVWIHDTAALLAGLATGGSIKLAPKVSPKKSLQGSIGGFISLVAIMMVAYPALSSKQMLPELSLPQRWILIFAASFCCNYGDLAESALKRDGGVKDSGRFLPGHGGFMDRTDSLLMFVPVSYWLFKTFLGW